MVKDKWHYDISVTSTSFKSQGEYDMFDHGIVITMDKKCRPTTIRFYDPRAKDFEDFDTIHE